MARRDDCDLGNGEKGQSFWVVGMTVIREIEKMSFQLFVTEAEWFLSKEEDIRQQMSGVNLCSLRLSDMGNTTLGVTAPPYDEIAQEAFSVWELFEGKYR